MDCFTLGPCVTEIWMCLKCWPLQPKRRSYKLVDEQDHSAGVITTSSSCLLRSGWIPQAQNAGALSAFNKNTNTATAGLCWMHGFWLNLRLWISSEETAKLFSLPAHHRIFICLHMQIFRGSYFCYLKFRIERERLSFLPHSNRRTAKAPSIR